MGIILGVVFVIMVVMNGALFYVLHTAASVTRKQVSACFIRELESYNGYLEEKGKERDELDQEKEQLRSQITDMEGVMMSLKSSPFYAPRPIPRELFIPTARYIDNDFFDNHKLVNDMMKQFDKKGVIRRIREKNPYTGERKEYEISCRLLKLLSGDILYEICTMVPDQQREVLREILQGEDRDFFEKFLSGTDPYTPFDCLTFINFLKEIRTVHDPNMYVRVGDLDEDYSGGESEIICQYDDNISEGLKIIYQNKLFDLSIYRVRSKNK